jgi:hypothetical protein
MDLLSDTAMGNFQTPALQIDAGVAVTSLQRPAKWA